MSINRLNQKIGFTLIEILIALFIFAIISVMLASSLRSVIDAFQRTEQKGDQLNVLRYTLLIFSREITHAIDRPIKDNGGKDEPALIGDNHHISFTYTGLANSFTKRSNLARSEYFYAENGLWRRTYPVLDRVNETKARDRLILSPVTEVRFEYWDDQGKSYNQWKSTDALPIGVSMTVTLQKGNSLSQFFYLPASNHSSKNSPQPNGDNE